MTIKTPAGDLDDGTVYDLTLRHGSSERVIQSGHIRSFEQDGEMRHEVTGWVEVWEATPGPERTYETLTIGFLAENVRAFTALG